MSTDLAAQARRILRQNDTGSFIKPSPHQYPHQWNWDAALIAMGLATFDVARAQAEVRKLLEGQWRDGMVPHILYHSGASDYFPTPDFWGIQQNPNAPTLATSGLTQPPVLATAVRVIYERDKGETRLGFIREVYPKLLAWHRWFRTARDPENTGLVVLIHPWESGMDNSTRWTEALARVSPSGVPAYRRRDRQHVAADERPVSGDYDRFIALIGHYRNAAWDAETLYQTAPFCVQDTFTNAVLHRADEDLLALAEILGEPTDGINGWLERTRRAFDTHLWDEDDGLYYDFDLRSSRPVRENTCATFAPLYAGLSDDAQAARLLEHLLDPDAYAPDEHTRYFLPSAAKSSPHFEPKRYWRGPVWININWLVVQGLRRYGYQELADTIKTHTLELTQRGGFAEYYDPRDGTPCGAREFSWSAALVLLLLETTPTPT